jgi:hypothetical protein
MENFTAGLAVISVSPPHCTHLYVRTVQSFARSVLMRTVSAVLRIKRDDFWLLQERVKEPSTGPHVTAGAFRKLVREWQNRAQISSTSTLFTFEARLIGFVNIKSKDTKRSTFCLEDQAGCANLALAKERDVSGKKIAHLQEQFL